MISHIMLFADFNNADRQGRIRLNTIGTLQNIDKDSIVLFHGLELLLKDHDGLEALGIVEFSELENIWVAKINWDKLEKSNFEERTPRDFDYND